MPTVCLSQILSRNHRIPSYRLLHFQSRALASVALPVGLLVGLPELVAEGSKVPEPLETSKWPGVAVAVGTTLRYMYIPLEELAGVAFPRVDQKKKQAAVDTEAAGVPEIAGIAAAREAVHTAAAETADIAAQSFARTETAGAAGIAVPEAAAHTEAVGPAGTADTVVQVAAHTEAEETV